jgi:hypothetical protein
MTSHPITEPPAMPGAHSTRAIGLGLLSFAPLAAMVAALVQFAILYARISHAVDTPGPGPAGLDASFTRYGALVLIAALAGVVAFVVFVIDALTNAAVPAERRVMWVLVLLFANAVAFPVYWYVVVWRSPRLSAAAR